MYWYTRRHQLDFAEWLDVAAPGVALGQAIGRWGNFSNQELSGAPTNLPWAIYIDPQHCMAGFANQAYYHPLFLYESLWDLANMALLLWLARRFPDRMKKGELFLIYTLTYAVGRFSLDFLRLDASRVLSVNFNQTVMGVLVVLVVVVMHGGIDHNQPQVRGKGPDYCCMGCALWSVATPRERPGPTPGYSRLSSSTRNAVALGRAPRAFGR